MPLPSSWPIDGTQWNADSMEATGFAGPGGWVSGWLGVPGSNGRPQEYLEEFQRNRNPE